MRALLVNPWIYDFKAFDFWNKPIGLLIVADILKRAGFEIDFIDCMDRLSPFFKTTTKTDIFGRGKYHYEIIEKPKIYSDVPRRYKRYGIPEKVLIEYLKNIKKPDIIFITSSMTYWYLGVHRAIRLLKEHFSDIPVVLGGLYATVCNNHAKKYSGADYVLPGPAEDVVIKFLGEKGYLNKPIPQKPFLPNFSLYKSLNYGVVITSRGCPFRCTYCATKILSPVFYTYDIEVSIQQIRDFSKRTKNIAFFDDALLCNPHFPLILEKIIGEKIELNLHSSNGLHCRFIDKEIAQLMFRANFKTIYLSLETTNPQVQKSTGDKVNTEEFLKAVKCLTAAGFLPSQIHVYLLYGMLGQSYEEIIDGIKLCHSLGVNPHLCEFSPIPYTEEFTKTGFDIDTDPLYHNNHFYTWYYPVPRTEVYKTIKYLISKKSHNPHTDIA
uniref:Radical SAM protein n=1 Tax=candidate division WOR-3 bacterium TaxID=2052148 RepID=A0A7V3VTC1_UNCW3